MRSINAPAFIARPKPVERIFVSSKLPDVELEIVKTFRFGDTMLSADVTAIVLDVAFVVVAFTPVKF